MAEPETQTPQPAVPAADRARRLHFVVLAALQAVMAVELALVLWRGEWMTAVLVLAIMAVTLAPTVLGDRLPVRVPYEFQVLAVIFVFAALFLGEVRNWYERIWWWDIGIHGSSGLLAGILGFLLVYVLNENERVPLDMQPRFVALFAFLFAVSAGAVWEIFEFSMDRLFGANMQKPMFGDPSGLTDTMWDLILDTLGAFAISALGWRYMRRGERSFIDAWIHKFIERNPHMFHAPRRWRRGR